MFFESHPDEVEPAHGVDAASPMRFAYSQYRPKLVAAPEVVPGVRSVHLGPPDLRTFDRTLVHVSAGTTWTRPKSTVSRIYAVIEGTGRSEFGDMKYEWQRGDMVAVPGWHDHTLVASEDAVLLEVSDAPLLSLVNWVREEGGD
jgi:gentisate 1,2-dioxygenase